MWLGWKCSKAGLGVSPASRRSWGRGRDEGRRVELNEVFSSFHSLSLSLSLPPPAAQCASTRSVDLTSALPSIHHRFASTLGIAPPITVLRPSARSFDLRLGLQPPLPFAFGLDLAVASRGSDTSDPTFTSYECSAFIDLFEPSSRSSFGCSQESRRELTSLLVSSRLSSPASAV